MWIRKHCACPSRTKRSRHSMGREKGEVRSQCSSTGFNFGYYNFELIVRDKLNLMVLSIKFQIVEVKPSTKNAKIKVKSNYLTIIAFISYYSFFGGKMINLTRT